MQSVSYFHFGRLLEAPIFVPLSRLTYTAYLIQPLVLQAYFWSSKSVRSCVLALSYLLSLKSHSAIQALLFSDSYIVTSYLGCMVLTYALSAVLAMFVEMPFASLEQMLLSRRA